MSEPTTSTDPDVEPAPKPAVRQSWVACGVCFCVVTDLDQHAAVSHPAPAEPAPAPDAEPVDPPQEA